MTNIEFDRVLVKGANTIGTVKIVMVKGEKGDSGVPTDAQVETAVNEWLNDHPEATTTVQDGSITKAKLANDVLMEVSDMWGAINLKVSDIKVNGVTQDKDASGVVNLTISDDTKADAIVKSASGSIASFTDGGDNLPMKSLKVNIVPKQSGSGDPSPSNVRPISGWDAVDTNKMGVNLFPNTHDVQSTTVNGVTFDITKENGYITDIYMHGTATSNGSLSFANANKPWKLPVGKCYMYLDGDMPTSTSKFDLNIRRTGSSSDIVATTGTVEITTEASNPNYGSAYIYFYSGGTFNHHIMPCIVLGNTSRVKYPILISPQTITTNLGQTVYGGVLDVVSGKLSITKVAETLANANIIKQNEGYYKMIPRRPIKTTGTVHGQTDAISSCFVRTTGAAVYNGTVDNSFVVGSLYIDNNLIAFRVNAYANATEVKNALGNEVIVYEIATPIEITLTPTEVKSLLGANNIWSESGTVEVEYRADTTLAYNELLSLIASLS